MYKQLTLVMTSCSCSLASRAYINWPRKLSRHAHPHFACQYESSAINQPEVSNLSLFYAYVVIEFVFTRRFSVVFWF